MIRRSNRRTQTEQLLEPKVHGRIRSMSTGELITYAEQAVNAEGYALDQFRHSLGEGHDMMPVIVNIRVAAALFTEIINEFARRET